MLITTSSHNRHILYSRNVPIVSGDEAISNILALEREIMYIGHCVGLSAPQVGISKSIAIIRHKDVSINLINPTIIETSHAFIHKGEGCMSLPNQRFDVQRFRIVKIKNHILWPSVSGSIPVEQDPNRIPINNLNPPKGLYLIPTEEIYVYENPEEDAGGIVCVAVQHEIDHLLGITLDEKDGAIEKTIAGSFLVGRNDQCPCGSGKKFKKCCMNRKIK